MISFLQLLMPGIAVVVAIVVGNLIARFFIGPKNGIMRFLGIAIALLAAQGMAGIGVAAGLQWPTYILLLIGFGMVLMIQTAIHPMIVAANFPTLHRFDVRTWQMSRPQVNRPRWRRMGRRGRQLRYQSDLPKPTAPKAKAKPTTRTTDDILEDLGLK